MARLKAPIPAPLRSADGKTNMPTPEQYEDQVELSGKPAKRFLQQFIRRPEWRSTAADTKREFLA